MKTYYYVNIYLQNTRTLTEISMYLYTEGRCDRILVVKKYSVSNRIILRSNRKLNLNLFFSRKILIVRARVLFSLSTKCPFHIKSNLHILCWIVILYI